MIQVVARSLAIYGLLLSLAVGVLMFATQTYTWFNPDFGVLWTAAQVLSTGDVASLYDPVFMTEVNPWPYHPAYGPRPWIYPPTALLFIGPLDMLPMWWAFGAWIAVSVLVYGWVGSQLVPGRRWMAAAAMVLGFPALSAFNTGQTSPIVAALIIGAIILLGRRPVIAGLLIATAGVVKPSLVVLAPLALIAGRHYAAFAAAAAATALYLALSLTLYGVEIWWAWKAQIDGFVDLVVELGIHDRAITPTGLSRLIELAPGPALIVRAAGVLVGTVLVVAVFARTRDPVFRLVALVGCSFLVVPYAMHYDVAVVLPAAVALILRRPDRAWELALTVLGVLAFFPLPPVSAIVTSVVTCGIAAVAIARPDVLLVPEPGA